MVVAVSIKFNQERNYDLQRVDSKKPIVSALCGRSGRHLGGGHLGDIWGTSGREKLYSQREGDSK